MTYVSKNQTKNRRAERDRWADDEDRGNRRQVMMKGEHLREKRITNALRSRSVADLIEDDDDIETRY